MTDSRWPLYYSSSKKEHLRLEDMAAPHIANAWRKHGGTSPSADEREMNDALREALESRGCSYDDDTGKWLFPEVDR